VNWRILIVGVLLAAVVALFRTTVYYRDLHAAAESLAAERQDTINDMQRRQKDVALLDEKYIRELADAQHTITSLESDVAAGRQRLRVAATCPQQSTSSGSLGDAPTARLDDTAQRDYFNLRERIGTVTRQVRYLQQYVTEQCLN